MVRIGTLVFILSVALFLRIYVSYKAYYSTFDTATTGVMALNILKGEKPLFFYGQKYMGAIEAYTAAVFFAIFGVSELVLSMVPIVYSLGWILATFLLFNELWGYSAGLVAGLCIAIPDWDTLWYCIGSYGGYPESFFLGTIALWIAVRFMQRELNFRSALLHSAVWGLTSGIALWTHPLSVVYIITSAVIITVKLTKKKITPAVITPLFIAIPLFILGALPMFLYFQTDSTIAKIEVTRSTIIENMHSFLQRPTTYHLWSSAKSVPDFPYADMFRLFITVILCLAIILFFLRLFESRKNLYRTVIFLLFVFIIIFLALYVLHPLARVKATRYTIPLWTMCLCSIMAGVVTLNKKILRTIGWVIFSVSLCYYGVTDIIAAHLRYPKKQKEMKQRTEIVHTVQKLGLRDVVMVGGEIFGYEGQILSFTSHNKIRFVSPMAERHFPSQLAVETSQDRAILCESPHVESALASLRSLSATCSVTHLSEATLFHNINYLPMQIRTIPVSEVRAEVQGVSEGSGKDIIDRNIDTFIMARKDTETEIMIDMGTPHKVCSLWLFGNESWHSSLPNSYTISVSEDGEKFTTISHIPIRIANSYINGNQIYFLTYYGMMECRFSPVTARYIRIVFHPVKTRENLGKLCEIFVFEYRGEGTKIQETEISAIAHKLNEHKVEFTVSDRWLSIKLLPYLDANSQVSPVYLPFNPKFSETRISRFVTPYKQLAFIFSQAVADECEKLMKEMWHNINFIRTDFDHYSLIMPAISENFMPDKKTHLHWNGHVLLKTTHLTDSSTEHRITEN